MFILKMTCLRLSSLLNFLFIKQRNTCFKSNLFFFLCFYQWGINFTLSYCKSMLSIFSMSFTMEHEKKPREKFFICGLSTVDPWTMCVLTVQTHLHTDFFPSWLMQFIWPSRQFKPRLFKGHLVVRNPHVWRTDLSYLLIFDCADGWHL